MLIKNLKSQYFTVYGVVIELRTNSRMLLQEMRRYYRAYMLKEKKKIQRPGGSITVIETQRIPEDLLPEKAICDFSVLSYATHISADDNNQVFMQEKGKYFVHIDHTSNRIEYFTKSAEDALLQIKFSIKILFNILLEEKGIFPIHCSGAVGSSGIILFCGHTHSGKTTALLNSLKHGYRLFSEDRVLFSPRRELLPFSTASRIDKNILSRFPDLKKEFKIAANAPRYFKKTKGWYIDLENLFPAHKEAFNLDGGVNLVFLNFHNSSESCCRKIGKREAAARLKDGYIREINNSLWWMMEKGDRLKKAGNAYRRLLSGGSIRCHRMLIGRDYDRFSRAVREVCGVG